MATTIKLKNSVTTTSVPSSLVQGEVAINITDKKVWVGNAATTPIQLLGGGADGNFTNISVSSVATFGAGTVSAPSITTTGDTNTGMFFPAADTIAFTEGGVESMRIDSSGQLGIGTNAPTRTLDVLGTQSFRDVTGAKQLLIANDSTLVRLFSRNASDNSDIPMGFYTGATERMRIDSSGNVGIGTSSPSTRLNVVGSANVATFDGSSATSISLTGSSRSDIFLIDSGAATDQKRLTIRGDGGNLIFGVENDAVTAFTERMRITTAGELLIGTTSLNDFGKLSINYDNGGPNIGIGIKQTNNNTGTFINFINYAGASQGNIANNNNGTVSYTNTSDYRLKENVTSLTNALDVVARLNPCTFNYIGYDQQLSGFIAHELQEVIPEAVVGEKDAVNKDGSIKPQGVDTSFLVATLTAAIQELNAKVEAQAAEIALLKSK